MQYMDNITFIVLVLCLFIFVALVWRSFINRALSEQDGTPSSKRLLTFMFSMTAIVAMLWSIMFAKTIPDNIITLLSLIILGGMGLSASIDIFGKKPTQPTDQDK